VKSNKTDNTGERPNYFLPLWTTLSGFKSLPPSQSNSFYSKHLTHLSITARGPALEPRYRARGRPPQAIAVSDFSGRLAKLPDPDETSMRHADQAARLVVGVSTRPWAVLRTPG